MKLLFLVVCAFSLWAQEPTAYRIGHGVSPPRILSKVEPEYSEEARIAGLQGTVVVSIVVSPEGAPTNIRVTRSLGLGLDEKAIEAVTKWKFVPGQKENTPVPVIALIEVNFKLLDKTLATGWAVKSANFEIPPGSSRPAVIRSKSPPPTSTADHDIVVLFEIDAQGVPQNVAIKNGSGLQVEEEVANAVRSWRFRAAVNGGQPIASRASFTLAPPRQDSK